MIKWSSIGFDEGLRKLFTEEEKLRDVFRDASSLREAEGNPELDAELQKIAGILDSMKASVVAFGKEMEL